LHFLSSPTTNPSSHLLHSPLDVNYIQCRIESVHMPLTATLPWLHRIHWPVLPVLRQSGPLDNEAIVRIKITKKNLKLFI